MKTEHKAKRKTARYTKKFRENAIQMFVESSENCTKMAKKIGIPDGTLYGWLIEAKLLKKERENKHYSYSFKKEAVRLYKHSNKNFSQVSREIGVSGATLSKWCREITIRNSHSEEQINDLVDKFEKSKLTRIAFAKKNKLPVSTLRNWQIRRKETEKVSEERKAEKENIVEKIEPIRELPSVKENNLIDSLMKLFQKKHKEEYKKITIDFEEKKGFSISSEKRATIEKIQCK